HWQNLVNFGVLPLEFADPADHDRIRQGHRLTVEHVRDAVTSGSEIIVRDSGTGETYRTRHRLSGRQASILLAGGQIPLLAR
ncbi:MAG: aconitate hydratase, partial [Trebonia sp.]